MTDRLYEAANDLVPKVSNEDRARIEEDMNMVMQGGSWDSPRARMYITVRMAEFERSLKVMNLKCKLLETISGR